MTETALVPGAQQQRARSVDDAAATANAEHIKHLVETWPALTDEQKSVIRGVFRRALPVAEAAEQGGNKGSAA